MKKIIITLLISICFFNTIQSQKINCYDCNGKGEIAVRDWITCENCKTWAKSYRDKVPCSVCKDNRGHYNSYYYKICKTCNGSGHNYNAEKEAKYKNSEEAKLAELESKKRVDEYRKKVQEENDSKEYEYLDWAWQYDWPLPPSNDLIQKTLIAKHKIPGIEIWNFDSMDEFKGFDRYYGKILGNGKLKLKVIINLEDPESKNKYSGDFTFLFSYYPSNKTWEIVDIIVEKFEEK